MRCPRSSVSSICTQPHLCALCHEREHSLRSTDSSTLIHAQATIEGLDPEGGAHLNMGVALYNLERKDEAFEHWRSALHRGSFESALQAAKRFVAAGARDRLPDSSEVEFLFGETLSRAGRSREAALHYATAHRQSVNMTSGGTETLRARVAARMNDLAQYWDEGEGAVAQKPVKPVRMDQLEITETGADGTTRKTKMTPEMLAQLKQMQQQGQELQ